MTSVISLIDQLLNAKVSVELSEDSKNLKVNIPEGVEIDEQLIAKLRAAKEDIISYLKVALEEPTFAQIEVTQTQEDYPASSIQKRIWLSEQLDNDQNVNNLYQGFYLDGLNREAFERTVKSLVERHESLRTTFRLKGEELRQVVWPEFPLEVNHTEFSAQQTSLEDLAKTTANQAFDLENGPLINVSLVKLEAGNYFLQLTMHHIISDAWSIDVMVKEIFLIYNAYVKQQENPLPPLRIQYKDYVAWKNEALTGEKLAEHRSYWLDKMDGEIPLLELPTDFQRPDVKSFEGDEVTTKIESNLYKELKQLAQENNTSLFVLLLASFKTFLYKYAGQKDLVVGSPVAGRDHIDLESQIGFYVNTLALRSQLNPKDTFAQFLQAVHQTTFTAYKQQMYPFDELLKELDLTRNQSRSPLFDVMLVLNNSTAQNQAPQTMEGVSVKAYKQKQQVSKFDLTLLFSIEEDELFLSAEYSTDLFSKETMEQLLVHFTNLLSTISQRADLPIQALDYLTATEKKTLLQDFNDTHKEFPYKTAQEMFEAQAESTASAPALLYKDKQYSYQELNEKANQLANYLREKCQVKLGDRVTFLLEPSDWQPITLLAILKSGGAYVPLDPAAPLERTNNILAEIGAKVLLVNAAEVVAKFDSKYNPLQLNEIKGELENYSKENPANLSQAESLAYIIYTSGSTGKPKGVKVPQKGMVNFLSWRKDCYNYRENDIHIQMLSYIFDGSIPDTFSALISGGMLVIPEGKRKNDLKYLGGLFEKHQVNHLVIVPSLYKILLEEIGGQLQSLNGITTAGEAIGEDLLALHAKKLPNTRLINEYGPTENSVGSTVTLLEAGKPVTIGKPIDNVKIYILSDSLELKPLGQPGEICLSGHSMAHGYWKNPALTAEKMVPNPFAVPGHEVLYRTGDIGQWTAAGNINFLGRKDEQVKIRGFRIELGEIEKVLHQIETIDNAAVLVKKINGVEQLVAYYSSAVPINEGDLDQKLRLQLPDYMMPAFFLHLEIFPLSSAGKLDRKALGMIETTGGFSTDFVAPKTEWETKLVEVYELVLGKKGISTTDNFFHQGGDSIKAIQIASRMSERGGKLEVRDIMKYPKIRDLVKRIIPSKEKIDQSLVTGTLPLSPIQKEFFAIGNPKTNHFNQSVMLYAADGFDQEVVRAAFQSIVLHHDLLRTTFKMEKGVWQQEIQAASSIPFEVFDWKNMDKGQQALEAEAAKIQGSLNLAEGLVKLALFRLAGGDRLLIVIHHLVVDGISWRILFEDFGNLYQQILNGKAANLPAKTHSYKNWVEKLGDYANSPKFLEEKQYWATLTKKEAGQIPYDFATENNEVKDSATVSLSLAKEQTKLLLTKVHKAYNTKINDLLLLALHLGVRQTWDCENLWLSLEGHGRENVVEGINLSRTIGWFTSSYPVLLETEADTSLSNQLIAVKEMLRQIPNNGIGYNILKQLSSPENSVGVNFGLNPQVLFNYLGQFDEDVANSSFQIAEENPGPASADENNRGVALTINGMVAQQKLELVFGYNQQQFEQGTIQRLVEATQKALGQIIEHCLAQEQTKLTPSDLSIQCFPQEILNDLNKSYEIEDIYRLSPLQEGMLFHSLLDSKSEAYFAQTSYRLKNELEVELVQKSLNKLMERHAVLRTVFDYQRTDQPIQIVLKNNPIDFIFKDIREEKNCNEFIENYRREDKVKSFDLANGPLMRVSMLQISPNEFEFIWSYHHIIMDGWCISILTDEFFKLYNASLNGKTAELEETQPYQSYIEWLDKQEKKPALQHWSNYLKGFDEVSTLPQRNEIIDKAKGFERTEIHLQISEEKTALLNELAGRYEVTLSNLVHTIWGFLLGKYNNRKDLLFGTVVSGRPSEVAGIETMVGLFINTVPVRVQYTGEEQFFDLVKTVQETAISNEDYHHCQLAEIQSVTSLGKDLINHVLVFENYPLAEEISSNASNSQQNGEKSLELEIADIHLFEQTNYDFELAVAPGEKLHFHFVFNANVYDKTIVANVAAQIEEVISQLLENPAQQLQEINFLPLQERQKLLFDFNQTQEELDNTRSIDKRFEEQVLVCPDSPAVIHNHQSITFNKLNERANQVAQALAAKGIGKKDFVGVFMDRGIDLIVTLMAIAKSGAIYVPLDPQNPVKRSNWFIEKSELKALFTEYSTLLEHQDLVKGHEQLKFVLCHDELKEEEKSIEADLAVKILDSALFRQYSKENLALEISLDDWAYMLFTSGSTGMPKGAILKQDGVLNHILAEYKALDLADGFRFLQSANISSDISVWQILAPLLKGGAPVIIDQDDLLNYEHLIRIIQEKKISIVEFVPSFLKGFIEYLGEFPKSSFPLPDLQWMMMVGEEVPVDLVNQWLNLYPNCGVLNGYGPAEASDDITQFVTRVPLDSYKKTPIGQPLSNLNIFIVDKGMNLLPIGSIGEIVVSGVGVGAGYWKDEEKTKENFVPNPFADTVGETIYRTGDLGRWLPDGNLEFYGRKDKQVKIRGFRVEPGEVEVVLREYPSIADAIVYPRVDSKGQKYLAAYLITKTQNDANDWLKKLRAYLNNRLPAYMIPSVFLFMDKFPINLSDKIDYKALPDPEEVDFVGEDYVAPRNEKEKILIGICQKILGRERLSMEDNFFMVGGDSIKAVQIVSRLGRDGFKLEVRDVMEFPVFSNLVLRLKNKVKIADQSALKGELPLLPIQEEFFKTAHPTQNHYNQAVLLVLNERMTTTTLGNIFGKIQDHHDILRTVFRKENTWLQEIQGISQHPAPNILEFDLRQETDPLETVKREATAIQASFDLENGPLVKLGLFHLENEDRLLVAIHHLLVDGVSWRILFEDFQKLYEQGQKGISLNLPHKTDAFKLWGEEQLKTANGQVLSNEIGYWQNILTEIPKAAIPKDAAITENSVAKARTISFKLSKEETKRLLTETYDGFSTEVNDLLLSSLGLSLKKTWGIEKAAISLESHGRSSSLSDLDVSRTIGWFTGVYPVLLNSTGDSLSATLIGVKENLRQVPNHGLGFGMLKYLATDAFSAEQKQAKPEILFNYLGEFGQGTDNGLFTICNEGLEGKSTADNNDREYVLDINGLVIADQLELMIAYHEDQFKETTITQFSQNLKQALLDVTALCAKQEQRILTPSDVTFKGLDLEQVNRLSQKFDIQNIYPLAPLQAGMLFHALYDAGEDSYFDQISYRLKASLDIQEVENSLNILMQRYEVLRAAIDYKTAVKPFQIIVADRKVGFEHIDIRQLSPRAQEQFVVDFRKEDKEKGFDLTADVLLRVAVIQLAENTFELVWSNHHIIMDGWCIAILIEEFFEIYNARQNNRQPNLAAVKSYGVYLQWLEEKDEAQSAGFWQDYLAKLEGTSELPKYKTQVKGKYQHQQLSIALGESQTSDLNQLAANCNTTINTLVQSIWSIVLGRFNNTTDVVFGSVVSGRPPEITGIEAMIGLFINTIPVRIKYTEEDRFDHFIQQVQKEALAAEPYHYAQLAEIQDYSKNSNLFDHILVFENYPVSKQVEGAGDGKEESGLDIEITEVEIFEQTNFDFELDILPGEDMTLQFVFNQAVYDKEFVANIALQVQEVIAQILENPQLKIGDINTLTSLEEEKLLVNFNDTNTAFDLDSSIGECFEEQAKRFPNAPAIIHNGTSVSYAELSRESNQIAHLLRKQGIGNGDFVGVHLERGKEVIVAMLAILKSGAAYVPLDKMNPVKRTQWLLQKSKVKAIFTDAATLGENPSLLENNSLQISILQEKTKPENYGGTVHLLDQTDYCHLASDMPENVNSKEDIAYMLFTSGSTGMPKGALLHHEGVLNHVYAEYESLQLADGFRFLQSANLASDISVWQMVGPLLKGGATVIIDRFDLLDYKKLVKVISENKINLVELVPTYIRGWIDYLARLDEKPVLPNCEWLMLSGEEAAVNLINDWLSLYPNIGIANGYGPAEASDDVTQYQTHELLPLNERTPIGKPLANLKIYVVDEQQRLAPIGAVGEILVAGIGVGAGYWDDPERTASSFINDPFSDQPGAKAYRTGDLGRWRWNGELEFFGRRDKQVKIRGYRVETGEIESILLQDPRIEEAVVSIRKDQQGEAYLAAYLILAAEMEDFTTVNAFLQEHLPSHMVPQAYMAMDEYPRNLSDKIDHNALPEPASAATQREIVAPRTADESTLSNIWSSLLSKSEIGINSDFFDLGGNSLKAIQLASHLNRELGVELSVREIFEYPVLQAQAKLLSQRKARTYQAITATDPAEYYEMSHAQKRLWILDQFEENQIAYNMPGAYILEGELDRTAFNAALQDVVNRHEILRTTFVKEDEIAKQKITPIDACEFKVGYRKLEGPITEPVLLELAEEDASFSFDLEKGPLLRANLVELENNRHLFLLNIHHIIFDGWSEEVLVNDIFTSYSARKNQKETTLKPLSIQYKDFAAWQQGQLSGDRLKAHKNYWLKQFEGELPQLDLLGSFPRPSIQSFKGQSVHLELDKSLSDGLRKLGKKQGSSLFMTLLGSINTLLYKYTGQEDIVLGTAVAGRTNAALDQQIGLFVNTLGLRTQFSGKKSFETLLSTIKEVTLGSYDHQDYPFDLLVEDLGLDRDMSRSPLFDIMVVQQETSIGSGEIDELEGIRISSLQTEECISKFDLTIEFDEAEQENISITLNYNTALFEASFIEKLLDHYEVLLASIVASPGLSLDELDYVQAKENDLLLNKFNNTKVPFPATKTVQEVFEGQMQNYPRALAVHFEGATMTYQQLNEKSNQIAHFLRENYTIGSDDLIGLMVGRSLDFPALLLGILKAGAAYVPFDKNYPSGRLEWMLEDTQVKVLIQDTTNSFATTLDVPTIQLDLLLGQIVKYPTHNPEKINTARDLAYVMYTSGSTGKPKGVMIEHRSILRLCKEANYVPLNQGSRLLQTGSPSFDAMTFEVWGMLLNGGSLFLLRQEQLLNPEEMGELLRKQQINTMWLTSSWFNQLVDTSPEIFASLQYLLVGGEKVSEVHIAKIMDIHSGIQMINGYGPTENTTFSVCHTIGAIGKKAIPIGQPISNSEAFILDKYGKPCGIGVPGELFLAGPGLARGYLNRADLTEEKFVATKYGRLYKTGDLARWTPKGTIAFIGRKDKQIKLRGYRIELAGIENALILHESVEQAAVLIRKEATGAKFLLAYVVLKNGEKVDLAAFLSDHLPEYMVPNYFLPLKELPLTPNGKLDRKALPIPENMGSSEELVLPKTADEAKMLQLWQKVLHRDKISTKDNFFSIGGQSLKAVQLIAKIDKAFEVKVDLRSVFVNATIEKLTKKVNSLSKTNYQEIAIVAKQAYYDLSHAQRRLWILDQVEASNAAYNMSWAYTVNDLDVVAFSQAIHTLVQRHEILRTTFVTVEGEPRQKIHQPADFDFKVSQQDLVTENDALRLAKEISGKLSSLPFDLSEGPLLRVNLSEIAEGEFFLTLVMHHIISDAWSIQVLMDEVLALYGAFRKGEKANLPSLPIQYKDYAAWQKQQLAGPNLAAHRDYWLEKFSDKRPALSLSEDYNRPAQRTYKGKNIATLIDKGLLDKLNQLCLDNGATLFMVLTAMTKALLFKYTGEKDITIGCPTAGRDHTSLDNQIGFYINTLALRTTLSANDSFLTTLEKVKQTTLEAFEHQLYPFDSLVDELSLQRDLSTSPLFDIMLTLQNTNKSASTKLSATFEACELGEATSIYDLSIDFEEGEEGLYMNVNYYEDIFKEERILSLIDHFKTLAKSISQEPTAPIRELAVISLAERAKLLQTFNNTSVDFDLDQPIGVLFEKQAAKTGAAPAILHNGIATSYQQLSSDSNQIAQLLRQKGIGKGDFVGVNLKRSKEVVVAMLAILKSGAAYVPLDRMNPALRTKWLAEKAEISAVFTDHNFLEDNPTIFEGTSIKAIICQESILADKASDKFFGKADYENLSVEMPENTSSPEDIAYMLFTSGSTGMPKGALLHHMGVLNHIYGEYKSLGLKEGFRFLQSANLASDISVWQMLGPILNGGATVIIDRYDILDYKRLLEIVAVNAVNLVELVPTYVFGLIDYIEEQTTKPALPALDWLMFSGEAVSVRLVNDWLTLYPNIGIANGYGPAEASDDVTQFQTYQPLPTEARMPIGKPLPNLQVYILNEAQQLLPVGCVGEIVIAGLGVGAGYWNEPEKTAESFIKNPFDATSRAYRTGDLGRWSWDGQLEFFGRKDKQVKIRGYRVELGEIEKTLLEHTAIDEAVITVRKDKRGENYLAAYLLLTDEADQVATKAKLRTYLQAHLPSHMVPKAFMILEEFPRNLSDKIDHKALPEPTEELTEESSYLAPTSQEEEVLAKLYGELLLLDKVSVERDFFDLGGNSLKAIQLVSRIYKELEVEISVRDVFNRPSVAGLAKLLATKSKIDFIEIEAIAEQDSYAMSHTQKRLWILDQFEKNQTAYNMPGAFILEGDLNVKAFEAAFNDLVDRHEILRTVFVKTTEGARQKVIASRDFKLEISYKVENQPITETLVDALTEENAAHHFDLENGPLLKLGLVKIGMEKHLFLLNIHHIISDGWSESVLVNDLFACYSARLKGKQAPLVPLGIQYKDFAAWQAQQLVGERLAKHDAYWKGQFKGEIPVLNLLGTYARPSIQTFKGKTTSRELAARQSQGLKRLSQKQGASLFMTLLASVNALLFKHTGQEDIVLGTVVAGRTHADLAQQIGFYANTLALRTQFKAKDSFKNLLAEVKEVMLGAYEHQAYPFDLLVEELNIDRDMSRSPLFDVLVLLQNGETQQATVDELEGVSIKEIDFKEVISKFDLTFEFGETEKGNVTLDINYNTAIFAPAYIEHLLDHYEALVNSLVENPAESLHGLNYIGAKERHKLLVELNDTQVDYDSEKSIQEIFELQLEKYPDAIAANFEGDEMTYDELNKRSNQIAHYLRGKYAIGKDDLVGLMVKRSLMFPALLLGVLKSGAGYLPIDRNYPSNRIAWMLEDAAVKVLILDEELDLGNELVVPELQQNQLFEGLGAYPETNPALINGSRDLAYVMYTSGSTGKPKGVMIEHRGIVRLVKGANYVPLNRESRLLQTCSPSFDVMTFEVWGMLLNGGRLYFMAQEDLLNPAKMGEALAKYQINTMWLTSSWFNQLVDTSPEIFAPVKYMMAGGEKLSEAHIAKITSIHPNMEMINGYGPTENTSFSTCHTIKQVGKRSIPIGSPISNSEAFVLDENGQLCGFGVVGELCVGGHGLARGYLNREDLTKEKFFQSDYGREGILYKTGDLARWNWDGTVAYMGRTDHQVKLRGFRIELDGIEKALVNHESVEQAAVLMRKDTAGSNFLVAYVVVKDGATIDFQGHLSSQLAEYMIPNHFLYLKELPLNPNGKLERKALPMPSNPSQGKKLVLPRNLAETKMLALWKEVLGKDEISIKDNFFNNGGHSLRAVQLISRINHAFDVRVDLRSIFVNPTIEKLTQKVKSLGKTGYQQIEKATPMADYPLSNAQKRLWILDQLGQAKNAYNMSWAYTLADLHLAAFTAAFEALIARHEILRTNFIVKDEEPRQIIHQAGATRFKISQGSLLGVAQPVEQARKRAMELSLAPFDLSADSLIKVDLVEISEKNHLMTLVMHHIVSDGWSMEILLQEILDLYQAFMEGRPAKLEPLRIQYKDFAIWQNQQLEGGNLQKHQQYWLSKFEEKIDLLELPRDFDRPAQQTFNGKNLNFSLGKDISASLKQLAAAEGSTLFITFLSMAYVFLYRYTQQSDIIIGTSVTGREDKDLEGQIGFYINMLALRNKVDGASTFIEFLEEMKLSTLEAFEHQVYPFDRLISDLKLERDASRNPLFDVVIAALGNPNGSNTEDEQADSLLKATPFEIEADDKDQSKQDLRIGFMDLGDDILVDLRYNTDLFKEERVQIMKEFLTKLITDIVNNPDKTIDKLDFTTGYEMQEPASVFEGDFDF